MSCYVASNYCLPEHTNIIYFLYKCSKKLYLHHINQTGFAWKQMIAKNIYLDAVMFGDPIDSFVQPALYIYILVVGYYFESFIDAILSM